LAAAAAAAALTCIPSGAQQFAEGGGVLALKKVASFGDGVKVTALHLIQLIQHQITDKREGCCGEITPPMRAACCRCCSSGSRCRLAASCPGTTCCVSCR
jgi:hypothetical protein